MRQLLILHAVAIIGILSFSFYVTEFSDWTLAIYWHIPVSLINWFIFFQLLLKS